MLLLIANNIGNLIDENRRFSIFPLKIYLSFREQYLTEIKGLKQIYKFSPSEFSLHQIFSNFNMQQLMLFNIHKKLFPKITI